MDIPQATVIMQWNLRDKPTLNQMGAFFCFFLWQNDKPETSREYKSFD